jgi:hypothetical protein
VTGAILDRPGRTAERGAHGATERDGGGTLEALLDSVLTDTRTTGTAECPVCHARMSLTRAHAECGACGSRLS